MINALGRYMDWDCRIVDPGEIKDLHPMINTKNLVGGLYAESDGSIDPTG